MQLAFYIVGKKNDDCYVLYDVRYGGKACASLYTIDQLIEQGYAVAGCNSLRGQKTRAKDITIVNLDGKPAQRISTFEDVPDTKRSAVTFIKGIKKSKEEVQKAKQIGEKRSQTLQTKKESIDPRTKDNIEMYKDIVANGTDIKRLTLQKVTLIYNYWREKPERIYDFEQLYDKNGNPAPAYYSRTHNVVVSRKMTLKRYAEILECINLTKEGYVQTNIMSGSTPKDIVDYFLKTTKKPFKYTDGLEYRCPNIHNVSISREEAIERFKQGMTEIHEYENYVSVNHYTAADMW